MAIKLKKIKQIFSWQNCRLFGIISMLFFMFSFTNNRNENRRIAATNIHFAELKDIFIDKETVNKLLIEKKCSGPRIQKLQLDLNFMENLLNSNPYIQKSEVYIGIDAVLKVSITQKTPLVRYVGATSSFYIDKEGGKMPLSKISSARVPLVYGNINNKNREKLAPMFQMIYDDEFLKKNIIAVQVMPNNGIKMWPRKFDYQVNFGKMEGIELKFKNYKAFYQKAMQDSMLYKYKKIDLRFAQQVVCTK